MDALIETFPVLTEIKAPAEELFGWVLANVFVVAPLLQLIVIGAIFLLVRSLSPRLETLIDQINVPASYERYVQNIIRAVKPLTLPVLWIILQSVSVLVAKNTGWPSHLLESAVSLLTAWIIIRLATSLVADPSWSRAIAVSAWSLAALDIIGMLDPTLSVLDNMAINFGDTRVSVLGLGKALLALGALFLACGFHLIASGAPNYEDVKLNAISAGSIRQAVKNNPICDSFRAGYEFCRHRFDCLCRVFRCGWLRTWVWFAESRFQSDKRGYLAT
jgi:hypothetical protein